MAGLGVYKLDNGESFPTNCFPIRSFHQSKEGAGHWLIAQRVSVENRYKILKQPTSLKHSCTRSSGQSECERLEQRTLKRSGNTLNKEILMALHRVERPSDLCSVDISERKLESVTLEGLEKFDSVAYINASDNFLTLEAFSRFPALRELELLLNGLSTVEVNAVDFPRLEVLDLSYNNLSSSGILAIGLLPRLKVLHLTGNNLQTLPPDMAGSNTPDGDVAPQSSTLFQTLEVLMLDDNKLTSCVFRSLSNLERLQHLNLEGNAISEVPYLQPTPLLQVPDCSDSQENEEDFCPPLPELRYLNLAKNKIYEEEALLAVALLPFLSELVIHSNPLTTQRSGDPPMLTWFLQDRLGIKIRRKKSDERRKKSDVKPHLVLPVKPKRKVQTKIPKVRKVSSITEALCASELPSTDSGSKELNRQQTSYSKCSDTLLLSSPCTNTEEMKKEIEKENVTASNVSNPLERENAENHSESQQNDETFFVTEFPQVNDLLERQYQDKTEQSAESTHLGRNDEKQCPEKLLGYEVLLDDNLDLDRPEPVGIQQTVKALEYMLKNLLVYRDSKANLQRLYKEQPKKIKNLLPQNPKGEKVKTILTEMKERTTISEIPLDKVLHGKDIYRNEYKKALILLEDMKSKYKMIHLKSMEQAAQIESNYRTKGQ
ncbi:X-ray radiation resistance-associated protein 1 isoform X1 [Tachysurus ichikawai]